MSTRTYSQRLAHLRFSPSQASIRRVRELRASGVDIIDFGSKIDTPQHVKDAAIAYLREPVASLYADPRGIPELRAAIQRKLQRFNGLAVDADAQVTVCPGGKAGIVAVLMALVDEGDEVLVEDPGWLSFDPMIRLTGAVPVPVPLYVENDFRIDPADIAARITPRTRVLVLCSPHNPTGAVLSREDLEAIAAVAIAHDLWVIMDEAYEHFLYDGRAPATLATVDGMAERTITVQTMSKTYNMFGWRLGWIVAAPGPSEQIRMTASHSFTSVTSFAQAGAAAALDGPYAQGTLSLADLSRRYQAQRDALVAGLRAIPGVTCTLPAGAYFVFPDISTFGLSSQDFAGRLLEQARVSGLRGDVFGSRGEGRIRFVFNAPVPEIEAGLARIRDWARTL